MLGRYSARTTAFRSSAIGPNRLSARRHDWTFTGAKDDCAAVAGAGMEARSAHNIPNARPRARPTQRIFENSVIGSLPYWALPNGWRLSCGADLRWSQTECYHTASPSVQQIH